MLSTLLAFVVTLGVLIAVHEWGHYQVARWCGVKVLRFSIGFGRVLWRRQSSPQATEFTLAMLPLGGYVRMLDSREGLVSAAERHLAFDAQPLRKRVAIVAAGPLANLLLAVLLYSCTHWLGTLEPKAVLSAPAADTLAAHAGLRSGDWVRATASPDGDWVPVRSVVDLRWRLTTAVSDMAPLRLEVTDAQGSHRRELTLPLDRLGSPDLDAAAVQRIGLPQPFAEARLGRIQAQGPADLAGLREGDLVLTVNEHAIEDAASLRALIRRSPGQPLNWLVQRSGSTVAVMVQPRVVEEGQSRLGRIDAFVGQPPEMLTVRLGPLEGLLSASSRVWDSAVMSVQTLWRMLLGEASVRNLSGPLTIADYAGQSARMGLTDYLAFLAAVSVGLGVLNLLPLPILDGGHLLYYLFEGVTGRPVSELWLKRLQRGGAVMLLLVMSIALSNDVARLLGLH